MVSKSYWIGFGTQVDTVSITALLMTVMTIAFFSFSMEIHVVFFNDKYSSFEEAKNYTDGVTVVSFFGRVSHF